MSWVCPQINNDEAGFTRAMIIADGSELKKCTDEIF